MGLTSIVTPDKDYEKGYNGTLSDSVREKCREFSKAVFETFKHSFGKAQEDRLIVKEKLGEIKKALEESSDIKENYIGYLEFFILNKGNYEFMIPYYDICKEYSYTPKHDIEIHHTTHCFGLLGTVDEILS